MKLVKTQIKRLCYQEHQTKLTPLETCSLLADACSTINSRPLLLTCESTLDEKRIMSPSYLTCADLNIEHTSHHLDPNTQRTFNIRSSPLNKRAMMVQERIEIFKTTFQVLMTKSLISLGRFNEFGWSNRQGRRRPHPRQKEVYITCAKLPTIYSWGGGGGAF